jgi:hypothetical protein
VITNITSKGYFFRPIYLSFKRMFFQNKHLRRQKSLVEVEIFLRSADDSFVSLIKILLGNNIPILSDSLHTSLLADTGNISSADLIGSAHVLFEVDVFREVHFVGDGGENESFLSSIGEWEFYLSIESTRTQEGRIQRVGSIGGHDDLDIDVLLETVHLVKEFDQNSLHLSVGTGLSVETS